MSRDITEGRSTRSIAVDLNIATTAIWQNTGDYYDVAINGIPFLTDITDQHPYVRATAPFRKQQFDSQRDPGEQSLTGWWLRSQSSFHAGNGIQFYDPFANPFSTTLASNSYRFNQSLGVSPWTFGQVTLLNKPSKILTTTSATHMESAVVSGADKLIVLDSAIKLVDASTSSTLVAASTSAPIQTFATDGTNVYYLNTNKFVKQPLVGGASTDLYNAPASITSSVMHWVKQRLVAGINNKVYEITGTGASTPPVIYTHPDTAWKWTDIEEGGSAIYMSGYSGVNSAIYKFALDSTGAMPTLTSGIVAAKMPEGEVIYQMYSHLGAYLMIGTNKGVRVALISDTTGNLTYGPLICETSTPIRGFAAQGQYIWCGTSVTDGVTNYAGTHRIDLSNEIDNLRFAVAQDLYAVDTPGATMDVAIFGASGRVAFIASSTGSTGDLGIWLESTGEKYVSGWLQTGYIRYNTLEQKHFKRIVARGEYGTPASGSTAEVTKGSMDISTRDLKGNLYSIVSYDSAVGTPEVNISAPSGPQDALSVRFTLYRDLTDNTISPIFKGYQLKSLPASPRNRIIKVPLLNYDTETDKYNSTQGWEGRAIQRLQALEAIESNGDVVTYQDFRTNEIFQCLIEEVEFTNTTPPDKRLTGFGGLVYVTLRTA